MSLGSEPGWLMVWQRLMVTHAEVIRRLEADLLSQHELSLTWFDVMSVLERAPEHRIHMHKIADAVLVTRSGLTRLVDRVEEAGLVKRERIAGDRRGVSVVLTLAGREKFKQAFEGHKATVEQTFATRMSPKQWRQVGKALEVFYS